MQGTNSYISSENTSLDGNYWKVKCRCSTKNLNNFSFFAIQTNAKLMKTSAHHNLVVFQIIKELFYGICQPDWVRLWFLKWSKCFTMTGKRVGHNSSKIISIHSCKKKHSTEIRLYVAGLQYVSLPVTNGNLEQFLSSSAYYGSTPSHRESLWLYLYFVFLSRAFTQGTGELDFLIAHHLKS